MRKLRTTSLSLAAGLAILASAAGTLPGRGDAAPQRQAAPPASVSARYVVVGDGPVLRVRNTVYVGGVSHIGVPTGSAMLVSTPAGTTQPVKARVAGGTVLAAIPDGVGGWYIGGTFTSVAGVDRPGLARLTTNGTLESGFAPPELGQVRALALDAGRLYVGGVRALSAEPWFVPFLSALDPATGSLLPVSYPLVAHTDESPAFGVTALAAGNGRLFAAFNEDNGIAAYDETSGALLWSHPAAPSFGEYSGPAALALAGGRLLAGGQISTTNGPVDLEELDPASGTLVAQPAIDGQVSGIAIAGTTAYVLARSPRALGLTVLRLGISSGTVTRLAVIKGASAIAVNGTGLYVTGQAAVGGTVRVYALDTRQAKPKPQALSPGWVGGGVNVLALQNGHLLVAGSFLGTKGIKCGGLAAFDARTGSLLPWRPTVSGGEVRALGSNGKKIYLAGAFTRVAGRPRTGLAAVSAFGTGKLLPWRPHLSQGSFGSLAVRDGRVFAGGSARKNAKASTLSRHLLVFSATSGTQLPFKSRIGHVNHLVVGNGLVIAENTCNAGGITSSCITAFRVSGAGRPVWRQSIAGTVYALQTRADALYVGGQFSSVNGHTRTNLAALALDRSGTLLGFAPQIWLPVTGLAPTAYGFVFATNAFGAGSSGPYFVGAQALGAVAANGDVLPWQTTFPPNDIPLSASDTAAVAGNFTVGHLTPVPGGLIARGDFSWIGPADNPAPGGLVWLR